MVREVTGVVRKIRPNADTYLLTLPAKLVSDSAFPFELGERVRIRIEGKHLIIEKA